MNGFSKTLTIFEGCDGSGKTRAAEKFAADTGARYVHFGPLPLVSKGLARMYVEAMLPAILGYEDLVFDRSWLSDSPYGHAFRHGTMRLCQADLSMLERVALRCSAVVVHCDPGWEAVVASYRSRKADELLENEAQLQHVYEQYCNLETDLPTVKYNYAIGDHISNWVTGQYRTGVHSLEARSAGNLRAELAIVGSDFGPVKDHDPFLQHPFVSFSGSGCSRWLTQQLAISEQSLYWVNADELLDVGLLNTKKVVALGVEALLVLEAKGVHSAQLLTHPAAWKRFNHKDAYPINDVLLRMLRD